MKRSIYLLSVILFASILSGCIISANPKEDPVVLSPWVAKTFTIMVFPTPSKYTWYVDGIEDTGTTGNTYSYTFDETLLSSQHTIEVQAGTDKHTWNVRYSSNNQPLDTETDITSKVQLTKSVLSYDKDTKTSYLDISIKNISQDILITPVKVVIDDISVSNVTIANQDGIIYDLKPYFAYNTSSNTLLPNGTIQSKRIIFNNPDQVKFTYSISVRGTVPVASGVIGTNGGTVQVNNSGSDLNKTEIVVPMGALSSSTTIIIQENKSAPFIPDTNSPGGKAIDFTPDGLTFSTNVVITIPYSDSDNDGFIDNTGVLEGDIQVITYNTGLGIWEQVPIVSQDTVNKTVTISTTHFTTYQPVVPKILSDHKVAFFTIDGLDLLHETPTGILGLNNLPGLSMPPYRKAYLETAIMNMNFGLYYSDIYSYGSGTGGDSWDGDATKTSQFMSDLTLKLVTQYNAAKNANKKFVLVTHSWGTILCMLALQYLPSVNPDLIITLSSPLGSPYVSGYENDAFIYALPLSPRVSDVENAITLFVQQQDQATSSALNTPRNLIKYHRWINYWDDGDIISGPLKSITYNIKDTSSPEVEDIRIRDIGIKIDNVRNFNSTPMVHALTSLDEGNWQEYNVSKTAGEFFRNKVREKIIATLNPPTDPITNLLSSLVHIPTGSFMMGSTDNKYGWAQYTTPVHQVTLQAFDIGKYEVTQAQYLAVMGTNPSYFQGTSYPGTENNPVEQVNWYDARAFCTALSTLTGRTFTLPSEAQWEYACRAGTTSLYSYGNADALLGNYAWWWGNSGNQTHPVGIKFPNAWGLYDMMGNVWNWCLDSWHDNYVGAPTDGSAWEPEIGSRCIIRGGGWNIDETMTFRSAFRGDCDPAYSYRNSGFRVLAVR